MGGEGNILVHLSRHVQNDVVGLAGILLLLQRDLRRGSPSANQLHRIFCVDVHAGNSVSVVDVRAQLPLVDVPVGVIGVSVIGDEAHRAVFQQIVVDPVAQIAVDHHDFPPALAQRVRAGIPQIIERRFHLPASCAQVALAGHFHAVHLQNRLLYSGHRHVERHDLGFQPQPGNLILQILCRAQLLRAAAGTDIGRIRKYFHNLFRVHGVSSFFMFYIVIHPCQICKSRTASIFCSTFQRNRLTCVWFDAIISPVVIECTRDFHGPLAQLVRASGS